MNRKRPMRRQPVQRRGQQRIDRLLDAADVLFAEVGYEEATTNAIAEQAETSIGSLYQFFDDKEAVLAALAARYHQRLHAVHEAVLNEQTARLPLEEVYDRVITALADFHRRNPGFRHLFYGSPTSPGLARAAQLLQEECIGRVVTMFRVRVPELCPQRARLVATVNVEVMRALLHRAVQGDAAFHQQILAEIKTLLLGYTRAALERWPGA